MWKWVTGPEAGTAFGYSNWAAGEPNNYGGYEDYLLIGPPGYGWNDSGSRVGDSYAYVIEYDELSTPGAVPEPATWAMLILGFGLLGAAMRRSRSIVRRAFA
ncbi:MAG: PEPxxWA-CTERM sorting domain-containing protein [Altererythrobacter sp.]|nr:PEPxxWA-CTERM sorting domain-containing protein [Altererythrobacter sp.]